MVGLVLIVVGITCYVVFTPERLTPIVRDVAAEFITCEHEIGEVELTFFSTFPEIGVRIDSLTIINPVNGAPSDTLLEASEVLATVDILKFLQDSSLDIHTLRLAGVQANIFISKDGATNVDIFPVTPDTIPEDTTAFSLPFESLNVDNLTFVAPTIRFVNEQNSIYAIGEATITSHITNWDDINLQGEIRALSLQIGEEKLADNLNLSLNLPHTGVNLDSLQLTLHNATLSVNEFDVQLNGTLSLQDDIAVDANLSLNDWDVINLLKLVPQNYLTPLQGIDIDGGKLSLQAQAKGIYKSNTIPIIDTYISLENAKGAYKQVLPYYLQDIDLQASAHLDLNNKKATAVTLQRLHASTGTTALTASGTFTEVLTNMLCDVQVDMNVNLPDANIFLNTSDTLTNTLQGKMTGTAKANIRLNDLMNMHLQKGKLSGDLTFTDLDVTYDSIFVQTPSLHVALETGKSAGKSRERFGVKASLQTPAAEIRLGNDLHLTTQAMNIKANARYNPKQENILLQWNPRLDVDFNEGVLQMANFDETIYIPKIAFDYSNRKANITDSRIQLGHSDFALTGEVQNIGKWLREKGILQGELTFTSTHTDVNELLALVSSDTGTEEVTDTTQVSLQEETEEGSANPFLVPANVDLTLNTHIQNAVVFDQVARDLGGKLYVQNGVVVIEEMGFICNAAQLQLTAIYKTPRRNHIFCGLDYHMTNINVQELINMIPQIDTIMPMLRSFRGQAEFHLAAETFLNANYELKTSTTRGACSIAGKDLVLLDSETFGKIAKILLFSKKTENKVDSIAVQATLFKKEIDIYPFCVSIDNYMVAAGGRHNLDMSFDYHINLLKPFYIGVDVKGTFDDLQIKPAPCRYAQDFRPIIRKDVETESANIKQMIHESLRKNVKE